MDILIYILIALAVIIVLFVAVVSMRPAAFRVVRSATMTAPAAEVFAQVNDFHKWEEWSQKPGASGRKRQLKKASKPCAKKLAWCWK